MSSSAIDNKRAGYSVTTSAVDDSTDDSKPNFKKFITGWLYDIAVPIGVGVIVIGSIGLYMSKVAQSNILPTDLQYQPFTNIKDPSVNTNHQVDINTLKYRGAGGFGYWQNSTEYGQKVDFSPMNNKIIDFLRDKSLLFKGPQDKKDKKANFSNFYLYFSQVVNYMISSNNLIINLCGSFINTHLPEWSIQLLYPFFFIPMCFGLGFYNLIVSIIAHFSLWKQWFRKPMAGSWGAATQEWEADDEISVLGSILSGHWWGVFGLPASIWISGFFIMPFFATAYNIFNPLFAQYKEVIGKKSDQGFGSFIKNVFIYKRPLIMILGTLSLLINASSSLGDVYFTGAIIASIIAGYFIQIYTYSSATIDKLIPLVSQ